MVPYTLLLRLQDISKGLFMKQVLIFIVALFLIFALVSQGGLVDIGTVGFVVVLIVSFLISKYLSKLFEKTQGNRPE